MTTSIYCPRCAKPAEISTSFCRTCGLSLDGIAEIVHGEAETAPEVKTRPNYTCLRIGIALFIVGTVIGLINMALRDFHLFPEEYGKLVFLTFVVVGMSLLAFALLFPQKYYVKSGQKHSMLDRAFSNEFPSAPITNELPSANIGLDQISFPKDSRKPVTTEPGSVTEDTTRQLS